MILLQPAQHSERVHLFLMNDRYLQYCRTGDKGKNKIPGIDRNDHPESQLFFRETVPAIRYHIVAGFPSRNGENSNASIGKASGDGKGSPQADRNGVWAEMPMMTGFSEGEGETGRLSAIGNMCWWKCMLRMDDARENTFPDTGLRNVLPLSRRLKCRQHRGKEREEDETVSS